MGTTIHISEADATRDFPGLIAKVRAGAEVIIDNPNASSVVVRTSANPHVRLLSESLRMAQLRNSAVTLDDRFGQDLEAVIVDHSEVVRDPWA
jgi:hypothetical protein